MTSDERLATSDHGPSASRYHHTQIGWVIVACALILMPALYFMWRAGEGRLAIILALVVIPVLALFSALTIDIDERRFHFRFGIGLIRRSISLNTISAYAPVRSSWLYGWGIRLMPHGILYNVSGLDAVELLLHDGRRVRVGTDDREALLRALEAATGLVPTASVDEFPVDARWRRRNRLLLAAVVAVVALWVAGTFVMYRREPAVELSADRLHVRVGLHSADLPVGSIETVQLLQELPTIVRRTNGFASGPLLRGSFRLEQWGDGRLFIDRSLPPFLVARTRETFVAVNFTDAGRTRQLYQQLRLRVLVRPAAPGSRP